MSELEKEAAAVNKQGDKMLRKKNYVEAIALYVESVRLAKEAGVQSKAQKYQVELEKAIGKRSAEINKQGDILFKEKDYEGAIAVYEGAWNLIQKSGAKWKRKYGRQFLRELNQAKMFQGEKKLLPEADKALQAGEWKVAIAAYKDITNLITAEVSRPKHNFYQKAMLGVYGTWAQEVNNKGDAALKAKNYEEAVNFYAQSVKLIKKSENRKLINTFAKELAGSFTKHAQEVNSQGDKLMKTKKYKEASEFYRTSVELAKQAKNKSLMAKFQAELDKSFEKYAKEINSKGDNLYKEKNFEGAAKLYSESVNLAKECGKKKLVKNYAVELKNAMGRWAMQENKAGDKAIAEKNFELAASKYQLAFDVATRTGNRATIKKYKQEMIAAYDRLAQAINKEGDKLYKGGQYEKAYELYDRSVKLAEKAGSKGKIRNYSRERNKALKKMNA